MQIRAHFVDGPLSGNTMMLHDLLPEVRVPYYPEPPGVSWGEELGDLSNKLVQWRELRYKRLPYGDTKFDTHIYVYEP